MGKRFISNRHDDSSDMVNLFYDGTFDGFLTLVFDIFELKITRFDILDEKNLQQNAFAQTRIVITDKTKSQRVWTSLVKKLSATAMGNIYKCYLSELPNIELTLIQFIQYVFKSSFNIESDFGFEPVLKVAQTSRKVMREKHRFEAFVRFKKDGEGLFYAFIEPDFNVLPLILNHFHKRYADQKWLIYDVKRHYGLYYNLITTEQVVFENLILNSKKTNNMVLDEDELLYEQLWKDYFTATNIPSRKNMKLHKQHLPVRYWKYLSEKLPK